MKKFLSVALVCASLFMIGCQPGEEEVDTTTPPPAAEGPAGVEAPEVEDDMSTEDAAEEGADATTEEAPLE